MQKYIITIFFCFLAITLQAALRVTANSIPQELRENASSVVRADLLTYTLKPNGTAVEVGMRVITIIDPSGREGAKFECIASRDEVLKSFSATTYDRYGKKATTAGKKDLKYTEYLPSYKKQNTERLQFIPEPASYPFSVVYHWERDITDGTMHFPLLMPQRDFKQSVEFAEYTIAVPTGFATKRLPIRHEENYTFVANKKTDNHTFKMENLPALAEDPFSKKLFDLTPKIIINPKVMSYKGVDAEVASWDDFANFSYQVLATMGTLSEEQIARIKQLTDSAKNVEEKFNVLKESMALNIPYVAFHDLHEPYPMMPLEDWKFAEQADSRMMALYWWSVFKQAEIPADYVAVNSKEENLHELVPNLHQFNAALLRVRLPKDTIWMDFSSSDLPAGYFNSLWRGKNWLAIGNDETHQMVHIPSLSDTDNTQTSHNVVAVEASGKATMQIQRISYAMRYEEEKSFLKLSDKQREKSIAATLAIPSMVRNVKMTERKDARMPSIVTKAHMINGQFATKIGNTLYMHPNVLHLGFKMNKTYRAEGDDILISHGYCNQDTVDIYPPSQFYIDRVPQEKEYKTPFGHFYFTYMPLPNQGVRLIYFLEMNQGTYPANSSREFIKFLRNVTDAYSDRIFMKRDE